MKRAYILFLHSSHFSEVAALHTHVPRYPWRRRWPSPLCHSPCRGQREQKAVSKSATPTDLSAGWSKAWSAALCAHAFTWSLELNWHSPGKESQRWVLLQQALGWTSLQHIRYDDGRLPALKVRVIPPAWDSDPEAKPRSLRDTQPHVNKQTRGKPKHSKQPGRAGEGQREWKDKTGDMGREEEEDKWGHVMVREIQREGREGRRDRKILSQI